MNTSTTQGCGSAGCQCTGHAPSSVASINGIALHAPDEQPDAQALRELAWTELLRQRAVQTGLLPRANVLVAPTLSAEERTVIENMLDAAVTTMQPTDEECRRYYEAHKEQFIVGQALHVRHILFAVTPGVNVHALTLRAESALLELSRKEVAPQRFEQLAQELSNCPSSAQGGDLGWVTRDECAPELANELFQQTDIRCGMGIHPRLIHTRFGFHIIEVLGRRKGKLPLLSEVRDQVASRLALQSRATALRQYMRLLVGAASIEGLELEGAESPLVQ
jgi:peptidyl-prolyl cis-trans isomerase C